MNATAISLLMFAITAWASPFIAAWANHKLEAQRKKWALDRMRDEPLIHKGAVLVSLQTEGRDVPILSNCVVTSIDLGRIELRNERGHTTSFTLREFEKLIWVVQRARMDAKSIRESKYRDGVE